MFIRKFLAWAATASVTERAPAAAALARALLDGELPKDDEHEAGVALAALADDLSPLVRRAIAEEIASRADAPRQILVALAADQSEIAVPVLRHSPALTDADLIDAAIVGDAAAQSAIAGRGVVSAAVCAALVEIGGRAAVVTLLDNPGAAIPSGALARVVERFEADACVREALLARPDLGPDLRARLVDATASVLQDFVLACGWMTAERAERATREAREKSYVALARETADDAAAVAVTRRLRDAGRLTAALLLRSLLSGDRTLLVSALAELTAIAPQRVGGIVAQYEGAAFAALYSRAGLPDALLPVFRFAIAAQSDCTFSDCAEGGLQRDLVEQVLVRCETLALPQAQPVLGLLRRFHAEAARQEGREFAAWLARAKVMESSDEPARGPRSDESADECSAGPTPLAA